MSDEAPTPRVSGSFERSKEFETNARRMATELRQTALVHSRVLAKLDLSLARKALALADEFDSLAVRFSAWRRDLDPRKVDADELTRATRQRLHDIETFFELSRLAKTYDVA